MRVKELEDFKVAIKFPEDLEEELPKEGSFPRHVIRIDNAIIYAIAQSDRAFSNIQSYGMRILDQKTTNNRPEKAQTVSIIAEVLTPEGYIMMQTGSKVLLLQWQELGVCIGIDDYKEAVKNHDLVGNIDDIKDVA